MNGTGGCRGSEEGLPGCHLSLVAGSDSGVAASTSDAGPGHWLCWVSHWDHEVFQGAAAAKVLARGMTPISTMRPPHHGQRSSERPVSCW